jgi:hypothetical protein
MKSKGLIILGVIFIAAGCSNNDSNLRFKRPDAIKIQNTMAKNINIKEDTLMQGDIFMTTGPAGNMEHKEGKVVLIADSGETWPVSIRDSNIMARKLNDNSLYPIKKDKGKTMIVLPDSEQVIQDGRIMLLTDDGEMMEVRLIQGRMVVITPDNNMLLLEKKL